MRKHTRLIHSKDLSVTETGDQLQPQKQEEEDHEPEREPDNGPDPELQPETESEGEHEQDPEQSTNKMMAHEISNLEDETISQSMSHDSNDGTDMMGDLPTEHHHGTTIVLSLNDKGGVDDESHLDKGDEDDDEDLHKAKSRKRSRVTTSKQLGEESMSKQSIVPVVTTCKWGMCNLNYNTVEELGQHISEHIKMQKAVNRREKRSGYVCEWDGCSRNKKPFKGCYNLEHHIRYQHTGEKPFACPKGWCDSKFAQHSDLKEHLRNIHCEQEDRTQKKKRSMPIKAIVESKPDDVTKARKVLGPRAFPVPILPYPPYYTTGFVIDPNMSPAEQAQNYQLHQKLIARMNLRKDNPEQNEQVSLFFHLFELNNLITNLFLFFYFFIP